MFCFPCLTRSPSDRFDSRPAQQRFPLCRRCPGGGRPCHRASRAARRPAGLHAPPAEAFAPIGPSGPLSPSLRPQHARPRGWGPARHAPWPGAHGGATPLTALSPHILRPANPGPGADTPDGQALPPCHPAAGKSRGRGVTRCCCCGPKLGPRRPPRGGGGADVGRQEASPLVRGVGHTDKVKALARKKEGEAPA